MANNPPTRYWIEFRPSDRILDHEWFVCDATGAMPDHSHAHEHDATDRVAVLNEINARIPGGIPDGAKLHLSRAWRNRGLNRTNWPEHRMIVWAPYEDVEHQYQASVPAIDETGHPDVDVLSRMATDHITGAPKRIADRARHNRNARRRQQRHDERQQDIRDRIDDGDPTVLTCSRPGCTRPGHEWNSQYDPGDGVSCIRHWDESEYWSE